MHHYAFVMKICLRYTKSNHEAEEVANDVFLTIFSKIDKYDTKYPLRSWIKKITVNKCIDQYRKKSKLPVLIPIDNNHEEKYDPFWEREDFENIAAVLKSVPEKYRLIFNLYVFEEYTHKEIAGKLNIAIGTSKSAVSRAKKIIKSHYTNKRKENASRKETIG